VEKAYVSSLYHRIQGPLKKHMTGGHIRIALLKFDMCHEP